MRISTRTSTRLLVSILLLSVVVLPVRAGKEKDEDPAPAIPVDRWLQLGPVPYPLPPLHDAAKGGFELKDLLESEPLPVLEIDPEPGAAVQWFAGKRLRWAAADSGEKKLVAVEAGSEDLPGIAWFATYVATDRFASCKLELRGDHPRRAWLDGKDVAQGGLASEEKVDATVGLTPGKHLLVVQTVRDPGREAPWTIGARFVSTESDADSAPPIDLSLDATRPIDLPDILDPPRVTELAVAPDGSRFAVLVSRVRPGTDDSETWLEIRDAADGRLRRSWRRDTRTSGLAWSPDGRYLSFVGPTAGTENEKKSTLYLLDGTTGATLALLDGVEKLGGYRWSPDGGRIVYGVTEEAEKDERGIKRLEGLMDRWAGFRDKSYLNLLTVPGGARRRITAGGLSTVARAFSPDGKKLLFSRQRDDVSARPYSRIELWELELETLEATRLREFGWLSSVAYSPDGGRLLLATRADEFGHAGLDLPEGAISNSYDGQLFVWEPGTEVADAITREFDPAISDAAWSRHDGRIYVRATDRDQVRLFRYDAATRSFDPLDTGVEVLRSFSLAERAPLAVGFGSSAWTPQSLVAVDLDRGESRRLEHPAGDWFDHVEKGAVEPWDFETSSGVTIDGRIYYPPGFDRKKKYPCLVYYYGGTSPVTSEFGGRYPKEWWASNGYVVYVMQPSGAFGFGQEFSSVHVNDWGKTTSEEIIEGTRKFLEAHPYVDPERVGCLGASYGGFMTMLLATKTDLFAAAVSHAGISSISSYWGEGYWGYAYSAVATANSFPWNRRDVYVDQSPLFRADELKVPILLTHGRSDTNVPVGESDAFYIAAKLLGKEIEYIQVEGQDHFIMDHAKRLVWSRSIVAWFDRWLKDEPEWWNDLYPE